MIAGEVDAGFGDQRCQPCDEIHRFESRLGRSIAVGRAQGVDHLAGRAERGGQRPRRAMYLHNRSRLSFCLPSQLTPAWRENPLALATRSSAGSGLSGGRMVRIMNALRSLLWAYRDAVGYGTAQHPGHGVRVLCRCVLTVIFPSNPTIVAGPAAVLASPPTFSPSQGFSLAQAGWFLSMAGVSGMVGKTVGALFADKLHGHAKRLAFTLPVMQAIGLFWLRGAQTAAQVVPGICMLGLAGGAFLPMHPYLGSWYFDARIIGWVSGAQMPLFLPFALVGAPLAGYVYDPHGNYLLVLSGLSVVLVVAALLPAGQDTSHSTGTG